MSSTDFQRGLQQAFKYLNKGMVILWRLGLGPWINIWPSGSGRIMVITHRGRKSGRIYRTPVNYAVAGEQIYCTAGFGRSSDWYRNLLTHPQVEVWLPDGWWAGTAEDVSESQDASFLIRKVLIASGFAAYLAGIDPKTMTDDELARRTASYRLIRIRKTAPLTGSHGPGDLAWVWPLAVLVLLPVVLRQRSGQRRLSGQAR